MVSIICARFPLCLVWSSSPPPQSPAPSFVLYARLSRMTVTTFPKGVCMSSSTPSWLDPFPLQFPTKLGAAGVGVGGEQNHSSKHRLTLAFFKQIKGWRKQFILRLPDHQEGTGCLFFLLGPQRHLQVSQLITLVALECRVLPRVIAEKSCVKLHETAPSSRPSVQSSTRLESGFGSRIMESPTSH